MPPCPPIGTLPGRPSVFLADTQIGEAEFPCHLVALHDSPGRYGRFIHLFVEEVLENVWKKLRECRMDDGSLATEGEWAEHRNCWVKKEEAFSWVDVHRVPRDGRAHLEKELEVRKKSKKSKNGQKYGKNAALYTTSPALLHTSACAGAV